MDQQALMKLMPHRPPMLLLDEAEETGEGCATSRVTVRGDEFFLQGHYPGNPVVPGVILCEMMAQTCVVLLAGEGAQGTPYFAGIQKAVFKKKVVPGDTVTFECKLKRKMGHFYFAEGQGFVGGEVCVSGEFSFAVVAEG